MIRRMAATTWGLAALALLLGLYVYVVEVRGGDRRERERAAAGRLLPFGLDAVTEVILEGEEGPIVCRKEEGRWRVTAPVRADADTYTLDRLLADLSETRVERTVSERPGDLVAFGLERPRRLTVAAGEERVAIEVGAPSPTGTGVFARRLPLTPSPAPGTQHPAPPSPVLLVSSRLQSAAQTRLYDLRDKTVLEFSPEEVTRITLEHAGRRARLAREPAPEAGEPDVWRLVEPLRARADRRMVERMFNLISYLRAEEFVSEEPERLESYGLDPPWGSARFDLKEGRSIALLLGRRIEVGATVRHYARRPEGGPVFTINDNLPGDAQRTPAEWRDRYVADFRRADAAQLRLITPRRTIVCAKIEGEAGISWGLAEFTGRVAEGMDLAAAARMPEGRRAERDRVEDLLGKLSILQAVEFRDGALPAAPRFGLVDPELKIIVLDEEGKALASLSVGRRAGERRYATGPHLGGVFLVPADEIARFEVGSRELAAR